MRSAGWAVLAMMLAAAPVTLARGQSMFEGNRHYQTAPGKEVRIGSHARWDRRCQPKGAPNIIVVKAPEHGSVSTRPGTHIARESIGSTNCNGREVAGIHVIYTPAAGFSGDDSLEYTVTFGGDVVTETISVTVR